MFLPTAVLARGAVLQETLALQGSGATVARAKLKKAKSAGGTLKSEAVAKSERARKKFSRASEYQKRGSNTDSRKFIEEDDGDAAGERKHNITDKVSEGKKNRRRGRSGRDGARWRLSRRGHCAHVNYTTQISSERDDQISYSILSKVTVTHSREESSAKNQSHGGEQGVVLESRACASGNAGGAEDGTALQNSARRVSGDGSRSHADDDVNTGREGSRSHIQSEQRRSGSRGSVRCLNESLDGTHGSRRVGTDIARDNNFMVPEAVTAVNAEDVTTPAA